jgi:hypothetical protein
MNALNKKHIVKSRKSKSAVRLNLYGVFCLFIMLFYLMRPVLPYVEYAINKDYIAKNLCVNKDNPHNCCQGLCHLHEQIKNNSEPLDEDNNKNTKLVQVQKIEDHLKSNEIFIQPVEKQIKLTVETSIQIISFFMPSIFIPPQN